MISKTSKFGNSNSKPSYHRTHNNNWIAITLYLNIWRVLLHNFERLKRTSTVGVSLWSFNGNGPSPSYQRHPSQYGYTGRQRQSLSIAFTKFRIGWRQTDWNSTVIRPNIFNLVQRRSFPKCPPTRLTSAMIPSKLVIVCAIKVWCLITTSKWIFKSGTYLKSATPISDA